MEKIFRVHSVAKGVTYKNKTYDNVPIEWYIIGRTDPPVPFAEAIAEYNSLDSEMRKDLEEYLMGQFTLDQAEKLRNFLIQRNSKTWIEEIELPLVDARKSFRALEPLEGTGFYPVYKGQDYHLPFKAEGFFNTNVAEESVQGDDKATVVTKIDKKTLDNFRKLSEEKKKGSLDGDKTRLFINDD